MCDTKGLATHSLRTTAKLWGLGGGATLTEALQCAENTTLQSYLCFHGVGRSCSLPLLKQTNKQGKNKTKTLSTLTCLGRAWRMNMGLCLLSGPGHLRKGSIPVPLAQVTGTANTKMTSLGSFRRMSSRSFALRGFLCPEEMSHGQVRP